MRHLYSRGSSPSPCRRLWIGLAVALAVALSPAALAQHQVTGVVLDADNLEPLPGVNVVEVGTQTGISSDAFGNFVLTTSSPTATLSFTYLGYIRQEVALNGRRQIEVRLAPDTQLIDDVVVTAFGIEREERALGFAIGEIDGSELVEARETNVANALSGKIAGVAVSRPASGASGSSRVIIRGVSTLDRNDSNQPLYVVDGVPIDNTTISSAGMWGGVDGGDGISGINPDDIESMTVLKGGAAAAVYGSRALNGAILITTKRAQRGSGIGVEYNTNLTVEGVLVDTDFQDQYGQGTLGLAPTSAEDARSTNFSAWGARLDGSSVVNWDGVSRPYSSVGSNVSRFYEQGLTSTNTLALTAANEMSTVRMSGSWLDNEGITPSSGITRGTFNLRGTAQFGSRLSGDAKINFIREKVDNRPRLSDSPGNANFSVFLLAPNVSVENMRCPGGAADCERPGADADGTELHPFDNNFVQNPYWAANEFSFSDEERRVIGVTSLKYEFTDWLALQGRFGGDTYTLRRTNIEPFGTAFIPNGQQSEQNFDISEINTDFLFLLNRDLTSSLGLTANLGGNILYRDREDLSLGGRDFSIPGLDVITNLGQQSLGFDIARQQINSLYGQAEFSYEDLLYVTVTGRNDWASTLPEENNSYFYPSLSASLVFSDLIEGPSFLDYGKLRAAVARIGGATDPYRLLLTYRLSGSSIFGNPRGGISQGEIPLADLKPYSSDEYEFGTDLQFFDSRVGLDATYYSRTTENQILGTSISSTSGFGSRVINAGAIRNRGVEVLLTTTPVRTADVRWNVNVNFAKNSNVVLSLNDDGPEDQQLRLGESRNLGNFVTAEVGKPFGTIRGNAYLRDDQGRMVFDENGLPVASADKVELGNASADWTGGVSTSFRFKRLTLSGLVDARFGGDFFSAFNARAYGAGLHQNTLEGREGGLVGEGVSLASCTGEQEDGVISGCSATNTVSARAEDYFGRIAGQIGEEFVYDGSFVKLRELQLGYRVPERFFGNAPIQQMTISVVGRNLLLLHSNVPNLDPEASYRNDSEGIGLELAGVPQTRSVGFNVNVRL
ncbi:SusC/RagA family TonB-linked outer membrane protein [Rubrivirga sp.]|uniref:SusC/RagA family TonB-linked outer membrane protein n=1 Tax=Rubrivirga sp. TaxID=1885344 RepID=UPI003B51F707